MPDPVRLRILVLNPPPDVPWAVQLARDALLPPRAEDSALVFEFTLTLGPVTESGAPTLRGPAAQGPPTARFVYVNSGRRAGDPSSPWDRRAKVSLRGITPALVAAYFAAAATSVLEARIAGQDRCGGPVCASVPLLGDGWCVVRQPAA